MPVELKKRYIFNNYKNYQEPQGFTVKWKCDYKNLPFINFRLGQTSDAADWRFLQNRFQVSTNFSFHHWPAVVLREVVKFNENSKGIYLRIKTKIIINGVNIRILLVYIHFEFISINLNRVNRTKNVSFSI